MRAIILVGGEGTRLRPLTYTTPKQMLPVVEVPMIERVIAHLAAYGIDEAILSLGYRPDAFVAAFPDGHCAGVPLSYVVEPSLLDTGGAIRYAALEAGVDGTFLVLNGDVLTDLDVGELIEFHRASGAEGTIALTPVEDPSAYGVVPCDPDGRVGAFIEKPPPGTAPTNLINAGTYVLESSVLGRIPGGRRVNVERETFPAMVRDRRLYALASEGYWIDVGTPQRYLQASADILAGRLGPPAPGAIDRGERVWYLGEPAMDGSIRGPALIGRSAVVARGAVVEGSVLGPGAIVEEGATVVGSVLFHGARVEPDARVEGSILGEGARIGPKAVLSGVTVVGAATTVAAGSSLVAARVPEAD